MAGLMNIHNAGLLGSGPSLSLCVSVCALLSGSSEQNVGGGDVMSVACFTGTQNHSTDFCRTAHCTVYIYYKLYMPSEVLRQVLSGEVTAVARNYAW